MKHFYKSRYFGPAFFLLLNVVFFWPLFLRSQIPVDPNPIYQTYPWKTAVQNAPVHETNQVQFLHQIDSSLMIYPLREEVRRQLRSGHFPLWTDLIFCGAPLLANQVAALDPISLVLLPLPTVYAFGLQIVLQLTLAGWFLFALCELIGLSRPAALFAGVAYMWNGFFFRNLGVLSVVGTVCWQPLLLYCVHRLCTTRGRAGFHGLAFAVMAQFFGGYAQYWIYNLGLAGCYAMYLLIRERALRSSVALKIAGAVALGCILALPQTLAFYGALRNSPRSSAETAQMYEGRNHVSPRKLITLAVPDLFGKTDRNIFSRLLLKPPAPTSGFWTRLLFGEYPSLYNRIWAYCGLLTLLIAFTAPVRKQAGFWFTFAVLPLLFLVLLNFDFLRFVFRAVWQGVDRIDHTRSMVITALCISILGGYGIDSVWRNRALAQKLGKLLLISGVVFGAVIIIGTLLAGAWKEQIVARGIAYYETNRAIAPWNENEESFVREAIESTPDMIRSSLSILQFPVMLGIGAAVVLMLFGYGRLRTEYFAAFFLVLTLCDLGYHGRSDPPLYFSTAKMLSPSAPSLQFLQKQTGNFRVLEIQRRKRTPDLPLKSYSDLGRYRTRGLNFFDFQTFDFVARPDSLLFERIATAGGYLSIYPDAIRNLWNGRPNDNLQFAQPEEAIDRWHGAFIDLQSIRYILADPGAVSSRYPIAYGGKDLTIFENRSALPRVFVVNRAITILSRQAALQKIKKDAFDPHTTAILDRPVPLQEATPLKWKASIVRSEAGSVRVEVETNQDSVLVLTDTFDKDWKAAVDERSVPVLRANYAFRAVSLSAGQHRVTFQYFPASFSLSLILSSLALVAWIASLFLSKQNESDAASEHA